MTEIRDHQLRHTGVVTVLVGTGAYPVAVVFHPPTEPLVWSVIVAAFAATAARAGVASPNSDSGTRWAAAAALLVGGCSADVLARTAARLATDAPVDGSIVSIATVVVGGLVAVGWAGGRSLVARMADAVDRAAPPGHVEPVGHVLLVTGCLVLAAAGSVRWVSVVSGWPAALAPLAASLYGAVALGHHQRLRRASLAVGWRASGRVVDVAVARNWNAWVAVFVLGALAALALWWIPPAEPLRRTTEMAAPEAAARFWDYFQQQRLSRDGLPGGSVAGESMPAGDATPADEERRVVPIRGLSDWLLQPATVIEESEQTAPEGRLPARTTVTPRLLVVLALLGAAIGAASAWWFRRNTRRRGLGLLRSLRAWLERVRAALAAMFARRDRGQVLPREDAAGERARAGAGRPRRQAPRWRRPSDPRDQVTHDYLRVLDRAGRRGLPRHPAQSPGEYAGVLRPALRDHAGALEEITGHFVEARYGHHPVDARTAERTKEISRTLRRALKTFEPEHPDGY